LPASEDGWVSVSRPERIVHQIDSDDQTVWVTFVKNFGSERVMVRFPEDPQVRRVGGGFEARSSYGQGEMALFVQKKTGSKERLKRDVCYRDAETGLLVRERHYETEEHLFVLRVALPSESASLFRQFADSLEIFR